jgi:hypothetical protein
MRNSLLLFSVLVLAGCAAAPVTDGACTRIGCASGVAIEINGALPDSYTVTLFAPGEAPRVIHCAPAQECMGRVFFEDVAASDVEIEIAGDAGWRERRTVSLSYTTSQPNGPGCPPICRQASARVDL